MSTCKFIIYLDSGIAVVSREICRPQCKRTQQNERQGDRHSGQESVAEGISCDGEREVSFGVVNKRQRAF